MTLVPGLVLIIGIHSICLGLFIYFFTDSFYNLFFSLPPENIFYVRQAGVFLFLDGIIYLVPLLNLQKYYQLILYIIFSKFIAVLFLVSNAAYTPAPGMIILAALIDGSMAAMLLPAYRIYRRNNTG